MIYNKYPYTNFHEMNDDWIINKIKEVLDLSDKVDNNTALIDKIAELFKTLEGREDPLLSQRVATLSRKVLAMSGSLKKTRANVDTANVRIGRTYTNNFYIWCNNCAYSIKMDLSATGINDSPGRIIQVDQTNIATNQLTRAAGDTSEVYTLKIYADNELLWEQNSGVDWHQVLNRHDCYGNVKLVMTSAPNNYIIITEFSGEGVSIYRNYPYDIAGILGGNNFTTVFRGNEVGIFEGVNNQRLYVLENRKTENDSITFINA